MQASWGLAAFVYMDMYWAPWATSQDNVFYYEQKEMKKEPCYIKRRRCRM